MHDATSILCGWMMISEAPCLMALALPLTALYCPSLFIATLDCPSLPRFLPFPALEYALQQINIALTERRHLIALCLSGEEAGGGEVAGGADEP